MGSPWAARHPAQTRGLHATEAQICVESDKRNPRPAPEQAAGELAPSPSVVVLGEHGVQPGTGLVVLPAGDHDPRGQAPQVALRPKPAGQMAAQRVRFGEEACEDEGRPGHSVIVSAFSGSREMG